MTARRTPLLTAFLLFAAIAALAAPAAPPVPAPAFGPVPELGYRLVENPFSFPAGWIPGEAAGVAVNSRGHVYLFQRAKPMLSEFDEHGAYVRSIGEGFFDHPHAVRVDADDNVWTVDDGNHTVLKLSPEGRVLLVLGRRDSEGEADWLFSKPADVGFGPKGEIYVADGYGNSRIVKFDRDGRYLTAWGHYGSGEGEFILPHTVVVDAKGTVYVGDRENARIQVFDGDGRFLRAWTGVGYPYGLCFGPGGRLYMIDGGYDRIVELDARGTVVGAIGAPGHGPGEYAWGHFLAFSRDGRLYAADVLNWRFQAYEPVTPSGRPSGYVPTVRRFYGFKPSDGYVYRESGFPTK